VNYSHKKHVGGIGLKNHFFVGGACTIFIGDF